MSVISLRIDEKTKKKMGQLKHINWSHVIREGILRRIEEEEKRKIDRPLLLEAVKENDRLKRKVPGYDSTLEIRKWREARR